MEPSKNVPGDFLKPYNSLEQEDKMLALWEESGYTNPDVCVEKAVTAADAETFSIVLPPPNVTGTLHMGHAAMLAIEDILIRYHRMKGFKTLWLPGTDSAAIATQSKVEEALYKEEKKTRHDIGREELLKRIDIFTEASKEIIIDQTKRMGSSPKPNRIESNPGKQTRKGGGGGGPPHLKVALRLAAPPLVVQRKREDGWPVGPRVLPVV